MRYISLNDSLTHLRTHSLTYLPTCATYLAYQPYVRRVRVSNVASVPVEIYSCFGGTVINAAVDGLRGHSSFKASSCS